MWGVLDPPEVRRQRSGSFYRRWTWRKQVVASGTRLLIVAAFALLLWGGWYLANRGFGREFRKGVVEELRKRGIEASVRKLTLDPFRGLVARDVLIYDARHREQPLLAINEVALDINYAALLHHQPFLNAIDVRDADLTFPAPDNDLNAPKAQLKQFRAHVYFPPDQIHISQAEGIFCGVRVSATGQLLRRADYKPTGGLTEAELRARMQLVQRIAAELGRFNFAGGPPSLQIKFSGDVAEIDEAHVEVTLNGERIQRGAYEMKSLAFAGEWIDERLNVTRCEWTDATGGISARASWLRLTSRGEYQARSSIALKPFLDAFGFGKFVADLAFASPPKIEVSGVLDFANAAPRVTALGGMQIQSFSYKNVALTNLSLQFSWDGERTFLRDVHVRHATGEVIAEMLDSPGDFRLNIESSVNPVPIRTLLGDDLEKFLGEWEIPRSPAVRMAIRGPSHDPDTWSGDGNIAVQRARFRGVWANNATANFHLGHKEIAFKDLHVVRDEGTGTGGFTYDWGRREIRIDNVHTHLRVTDVIYWIKPEFFRLVAPYKFHSPPNLVANGVVQYRGGEKTHLTINVEAPEGMDYVFINKTLPFDRVKGSLLITEDRVQLVPVEAGLFGGVVRGNANIITKESDAHYSAALAFEGVDFPKLTDLYFKYETAHGQLAGKYTWQARGDDVHTMVGNGEMKVSNGDVFAIPILGPLSSFLGTIVPGAGYSIAKQATATFNIRDGIIRTNDFKVSGKAYDMLGHGEIDFINDKLNMDMRIGARGAGVVLTPLYNLFEYKGEGSIAKPNWHPKNF